MATRKSFTRGEAVLSIMCAYDAARSEFCVGKEEHEDSIEEMFAALRALGVTEEELQERNNG